MNEFPARTVRPALLTTFSAEKFARVMANLASFDMAEAEEEELPEAAVEFPAAAVVVLPAAPEVSRRSCV